MIWVKSALAGLAAAVVVVIATVVATTRVWIDGGQGTGGIGTISFGFSELMLFPFAVAFGLGFRWMFRREQRRLAR